VTAAGTVLASYGQLKNDNGGTAKTTEFSLAYDHAISKRTGAYAGVNNTKVTGAKAANTFAVGVRHAF
jgi:predicted porin